MGKKRKRPVLEFRETEVTSVMQIAPEVYVLKFPRFFDFRAGQVVAIKIREDQPHRLYSIASGEKDAEISILFDINPEGLLTPALAEMKPGDKLIVSMPFGFFVDDESPAWWIATGTGIAPFISMFKSMDVGGKTLVHGGRMMDSFYFQNDFIKSDLKDYIRCSSKEEGEGVYPGRLTKWLKEEADLDIGQRYFLCGNAEMIVEVRDFLIEKGIPFENIRAEIYF